jgi:hypothetical protein
MAYLDGELAADRAATVASHVDGCLECRALVREFQAVSRRMGEWQVRSCGLQAVGERPVRRWGWKRMAGVLTFAGCLAVGGMLVMYRVTERYPMRVAADLSPASGRMTSMLVLPEPMIARTAQLAIIASDFAHARERLEAILKSHHGYMGQLTATAPTGTGRTLDASLRIPSGELDTTMTELKKLGRVESESQSGEDVTRQYVDLEARLANARNAEQRLTAVLKQQTGKMEDVLAVEKEITRVRGEIEAMEAERKTLGGRVEFATITVKISEEYKAPLQGPASIGTRLTNAAVAGYRHLADGAMGLAEFGLEYGLSLAIWMAVLFWPARWMWKRIR